MVTESHNRHRYVCIFAVEQKGLRHIPASARTSSQEQASVLTRFRAFAVSEEAFPPLPHLLNS